MAIKAIQIFSLSLLDMLCCAFGGVIILAVVFSAMITQMNQGRPPSGLGVVAILSYEDTIGSAIKENVSALTKGMFVEFWLDTLSVDQDYKAEAPIARDSTQLGVFNGVSRINLQSADPKPIPYSYSVGMFRFENSYFPDSLQLYIGGMSGNDFILEKLPPRFVTDSCFKLTWILYEKGFPPAETHCQFTWQDLKQRKRDRIPLAVCRTYPQELNMERRYQFTRP